MNAVFVERAVQVAALQAIYGTLALSHVTFRAEDEVHPRSGGQHGAVAECPECPQCAGLQRIGDRHAGEAEPGSQLAAEMAGDSPAGFLRSRAGYTAQLTMTSLTLAPMAARYGTSSVPRIAAADRFRVTGPASVFWDLVAAPRPGRGALQSMAGLSCCWPSGGAQAWRNVPGNGAS